MTHEKVFILQIWKTALTGHYSKKKGGNVAKNDVVINPKLTLLNFIYYAHTCRY
jgi:hypothetical protein